MNFTAGFPKLGYTSIRELFQKHNIEYGQRNLVQASDPKERLELLNINKKTHLIASVDAKMFYPSVKYALIERAVHYYANKANLTTEERERVNTCLSSYQVRHVDDTPPVPGQVLLL